MVKIVIVAFVAIVFFTACTPTAKTPPFSIPFPFDKQKWQTDSLACNGYRQSIIDSITTHEAHFLYKTHIDTFLNYFGGYRNVEQYSNTQRYYYWYQPGYHCSVDLTKSTQYKLSIDNEPFFAVEFGQKSKIIINFREGEP